MYPLYLQSISSPRAELGSSWYSLLLSIRRACKRQSSSTRHSQGQIAVVCPWLAKLPREEEARAEAHAFRVKVRQSFVDQSEKSAQHPHVSGLLVAPGALPPARRLIWLAALSSLAPTSCSHPRRLVPTPETYYGAPPPISACQGRRVHDPRTLRRPHDRRLPPPA